ncbi:complement component 1 Q subcomponent-binding protein, mitochondrial-like [Apostichopus japonicus]|uniref:complement component 1 Q subcomponent-binding protein, mitochondrial-like n=1 Tax=Stichopus japonicus TaxID=307972 RepID=UPI003AB8E231
MAFSNVSSRTSRIISRAAQFTRSIEATSSCVNQINRSLARSVWHLSSNKDRTGSSLDVVGSVQKSVTWPGKPCTCGCAGLHTEADKQLSNFLAEEIQIEKESQKNPKIPTIAGFSVTTDGAEVTLTKEGSSDERVQVIFNVNHSVEFEENVEAEPPADSKDTDTPDGQMRSYPDFRVELTKSGKSTIAVQCSYTTDDDFNAEEEVEEGEADNPQDDLFLIDEVYMFKDQANEKTYRVGSEVMQGEMYDHLLALLESRGVDNEFADKLSDLASSFEHSSFIKFLESLKDTIKE